MEQKIQIKTPDDHIIYWTLNAKNVPSEKLIIFVHWFTWNQQRHLHYNSARYFPKHWFTTFRFNLYDGREKGRRLKDCTIEIHGKDIDIVVNYFKNKFKEIYIVWHSLWWPSIVKSSQFIDKIVLWDPSLVLKDEDQKAWVYNDFTWMYKREWGVDSYMNKKMYDEWLDTWNRMIPSLKRPVKIICWWNFHLAKRREQKIHTIPVSHEYISIEWAWHWFDEEGCEEELFEETLKYFE